MSMHRKTSEPSRSSEDSYPNPEIDDRSNSSIGMDNHSDERQMNSTTNTTSSATVRRSDSSSSGEPDDSFQIDVSMFEVNFQKVAMKFNNNNSFPTNAIKSTASGTTNPASKQVKSQESCSESCARSEVENNNNKPPVPRPTFQVYNVTNHNKGVLPTTSPPIQVMDRSKGYDPARIPSTVFERHNGLAVEWSVCSNDSLFSLNLGNHSLSRESANTFGELATSEELSKSGEMNSFGRMPSIIIEETESSRESVNSKNSQANNALHEPSMSLEERLFEEQNEGKDLSQSASSKSSKFVVSSISHHSSETSAQSFAFPVSDNQSMRHIPFEKCRKKRARTLWCCNSNCSWAFCCCSWPSCNCNCKCSTCGWTFCSIWNSNHRKGSANASPILTEAERKGCVEGDISEHHQSSYKKEPEVTSKCRWRNCCNWFHCFSCCSSSCCSSSCCKWSSCCSRKPCYKTAQCRWCC